MERVLYESLKHGETSWWYVGRTKAVRTLLTKNPPESGAALDFGAGYGAMFPLLSAYGPVDAFEVDADCLSACRERGYSETLSSMEALEAKRDYSLIGAFDVLEHIKDDTHAVQVLRQALAPNGVLVATVPAHSFLWSEHDVLNQHVRRYSMKSFRALLENNGFVIERISYWNCALLPVAMIMRYFGKGGKEGLVPAAPINFLLTLLVTIEAWLLSFIPLPMGISIMVRARPK